MRLSDVNPYIRYGEKLLYTPSGRELYVQDCRLFYILEGEGSIILDSETISLVPNTLFYCPGGTKYKIRSKDKFLLYVLDFDLTQRKNHITNIIPMTEEEKPPLDYCSFEDSTLLSAPFVLENAEGHSDAVKDIVEEFTKEKLFFREAASAKLKTLLTALHREKREKKEKTAQTVSEITKYIKKNFYEDISNGALASMAGYHEYYLNRIFIKHTGKSMHRYILDLRLGEAKRLLLGTDNSISEIALSVGFNSASHFSTYFKKVHNATPFEYRNKYRENI